MQKRSDGTALGGSGSPSARRVTRPGWGRSRCDQQVVARVLSDDVLSVLADTVVALSLTSCSTISDGNGVVGGAAAVNVRAVPPTVTARLVASNVLLPSDAEVADVTVVTPPVHARVSCSPVSEPLVVVRRSTWTSPRGRER